MIVEGAAETSVCLVHGEEVVAVRHFTAPFALDQQAGARLGQLGTEQNRMRQNRAKQSKTKHSRTEQNRAQHL
jgi:hypothetical protein